MRVHAINTGVMQVKSNYVHGRGRLWAARMTSVLLDSHWRDVPVYAWAIEHPEGVIVIDTGESAAVRDRSFFPPYLRPLFSTQHRFHVTPETEIGPQLQARGIRAADVRWLILTHTHFDHTDALYHFPNVEVLVSQREWHDTMRWRSAHLAFPNKWPQTLKVNAVDYPHEPIGGFEYSYPVTKAGDVRLVPTPGHTLGHQSVILQDGDSNLFFAGDASFDLPSLLNDVLDAPAFNATKTLASRRDILDTARKMPLVYLSTHDHDTLERLTNRTPIVSPQSQPLEHRAHQVGLP